MASKKESASWGESKNDSKGEVDDQSISELSLKKKQQQQTNKQTNKRQSRLDVLFLTDEKHDSFL